MNKDCGFYQMDHIDDSMLTNANWDHYEIRTRNIQLLGGTYNQNCLNQAHDHHHGERYYTSPDGRKIQEISFNLCLEFYGVGDMLVRDITIAQFRTFAFTVGCFKNVTIENVWLDMQHHTISIWSQESIRCRSERRTLIGIPKPSTPRQIPRTRPLTRTNPHEASPPDRNSPLRELFLSALRAWGFVWICEC